MGVLAATVIGWGCIGICLWWERQHLFAASFSFLTVAGTIILVPIVAILVLRRKEMDVMSALKVMTILCGSMLACWKLPLLFPLFLVVIPAGVMLVLFAVLVLLLLIRYVTALDTQSTAATGSRSPETMAGMAWHYGHDGAQFGPVSIMEIRKLIAADKLCAEDFVWRKGMNEWTPLGQVEGLFLPPPLPSRFATAIPALPQRTSEAVTKTPRLKLIGSLMVLLGLLFTVSTLGGVAKSIIAAVQLANGQTIEAWVPHGMQLFVLILFLVVFLIQCVGGLVGGISMLRRRRYSVAVVGTVLFTLAGLGVLSVWQAARIGCDEFLQAQIVEAWYRPENMDVSFCRILAFESLWIILGVPALCCLLGTWSLLTLRNPLARRQFRNQSDPLEPLMNWLLLRRCHLPPTSRNTTRATLATIAGLFGVAFLIGTIHGMMLPPYAHVSSRCAKLVAAKLAQVLEKYNVENLSKLPRDAGEKEHEELDKEIDALLASVKPPPIDVDDSCRDTISGLTIEPPPKMETASLFGFSSTCAVFRVKFRTKTYLDKSKTGLVVRTYGRDGTILDDNGIILDTDASSGEMVMGRFGVGIQTSLGNISLRRKGNTLAKAYRFVVARKSEGTQ